jgi:hypothetical protein
VRLWGLRGADVAAIVKQYAEKAGLDPQEFSGHSLCGGFVTSAAESGASILKIQETSRRKSTDVLTGHVRRVDTFKDHGDAAFLWTSANMHLIDTDDAQRDRMSLCRRGYTCLHDRAIVPPPLIEQRQP